MNKHLILNIIDKVKSGSLAAHRIASRIAHRAAESVVKTGGFTLSPFRATPVKGYAVSLAGNEVKYRLPLSADELHYAVLSYAEARMEVIWENRGKAFFGGWLDEASDTLYLDVSVIVDTVDEAYDIAVANRQLAIYSLVWGESIDCTSPSAFAEAKLRLSLRDE